MKIHPPQNITNFAGVPRTFEGSDPGTSRISHSTQTTNNLTLPSDVGSTARQNFIMRMLFTDMY